MSFTWDGNVGTPVEQIRSLLHDTDSGDPFLQDEEIVLVAGAAFPGYTTSVADLFRAAAVCARMIASRFARKVDRSALSLSDSPSRQVDAWTGLADMLDKQASTLGATSPRVFFGGRTISGKIDLANDTDAVQPVFQVGMDRNDTTPTRGGFDQDGSN